MQLWLSVLFSDSPPSSRPVAALQYPGFRSMESSVSDRLRKLPIGIRNSSSFCENSMCTKSAPGLKSPPANQKQKAPWPSTNFLGQWFSSCFHLWTIRNKSLVMIVLGLVDYLSCILNSKQPMAHGLHTIAQGQMVSIYGWRWLTWWFLP